MSEAAEKVLFALLELPLDERMEVVDIVYANLPKPPGVMSDDDPELDAILDRRREEMLSGKVKGIPAEEFFRTLREERAAREARK